jgi:glycosyltransferase involved in cell wall biosynthesis
VFFFPTQYEGYGIATAEAMACSCAVVTTPTGLGWELESGKEAMICDFDDIAKMTQAVEALLTDDAVFQKIAHAGWEKTQALRLERCMDTLQHTYSQWLKHHKALP